MLKNKRLFLFGLFLCLSVTFSGCKSQFEKLLASNATAKKYQEGLRLYNKKSYSKALILFNDLLERYRGTDEAQDLAYYFAYTNYHLLDYTTARYQFKLFADTYPNSDKAEECRYMGAYCYYLESPKYSLDQGNTLKAIESLQLFINLYPKSDRVAEASRLIDDLRDKLETKAFLNAKLYLDSASNDITYDRSAAIAFKNALRDYPDIKYAEEMEFLTIKAQYLYAKNSLETKQEERFNEAIMLYDEFKSHYPESKFLTEAEVYKKDAEQSIIEVRELLTAGQTSQKIKQNPEEQINK